MAWRSCIFNYSTKLGDIISTPLAAPMLAGAICFPLCRVAACRVRPRELGKKKNTHKLFAHKERHKSVMLKSQIICHFELKISFKGLSRVIFMLNLYILIPTIIIRTTTSAAFYSSRTMPGFFRCIAATCVYYVCCAVSIFYYEAVSI